MEEGRLLRVFIGEADRHEGRPLHQWLVETAHARGLAGATVLRALEGYGAASRVRTSRIMRLSTDLPLVVEIVDAQERVDEFVALLDGVLDSGLVTVETVQMRLYGARSPR